MIEETNANNQLILDNAAVQKLTHQEVETLKAESLKGNLTNDVSDTIGWFMQEVHDGSCFRKSSKRSSHPTLNLTRRPSSPKPSTFNAKRKSKLSHGCGYSGIHDDNNIGLWRCLLLFDRHCIRSPSISSTRIQKRSSKFIHSILYPWCFTN